MKVYKLLCLFMLLTAFGCQTQESYEVQTPTGIWPEGFTMTVEFSDLDQTRGIAVFDKGKMYYSFGEEKEFSSGEEVLSPKEMAEILIYVRDHQLLTLRSVERRAPVLNSPLASFTFHRAGRTWTVSSDYLTDLRPEDQEAFWSAQAYLKNFILRAKKNFGRK